MANVLVVYDSKYGNTKLVADKIVEGLKQVEGIESTSVYAKTVKPEKMADFDALLVGGPNHMGKPSRTIRRFVDELAKADLARKKVAVFDTYFGRQRNFEKAMKKLEKTVEAKLSGWELLAPGLSIKVTGIKGPIADGELSKCVDFGKRLASQLK